MKAEPSSDRGTAVCNFYGPQGTAQSVSLRWRPACRRWRTLPEMAAWRKEQTEGYGDIKLIIEPVEGLGVPAIRNEVEGTQSAMIESAVKGVLLDVTTANLEHSKALTNNALPRLP